MDRLIRTAWRAFWVGLGASAVLIAQSLAGPGPAPVPADTSVTPPPPSSPAAVPAERKKSADPILSRNPFDSQRGPIHPRSI